MTDTTTGEGWAVGSIDGMGDGPGFRKVRRELDVKAFGVNAVVMPPGYASGPHYHDRQEELYLVHRGSIEFTFGEGDEEEYHELGPGGLARVDAATIRRFPIRTASRACPRALLILWDPVWVRSSRFRKIRAPPSAPDNRAASYSGVARPT